MRQDFYQTRICLSLLLAGITFSCIPSFGHAGDKIFVGQKWPANQQLAIGQVRHDNLDALLKKYVDPQGDVAYSAWQANSRDLAVLDQYLAHLSQANPALQATAAEKLAYWINAYNAVTLRGILREYPTSSIRNHTAKFLGYNIWHDLLLHVGGSTISLDQIEHKVLRRMNEPRIHFAIVCASRSCPKLRNEAYQPTRLNDQLQTNTVEFFAQRGNFRYDGGRFYISSILSWFAEDFGKSQAEQLRYIAPFLPDANSQRVAGGGRGTISYLDYDWNLNDQKTAVRIGRK